MRAASKSRFEQARPAMTIFFFMMKVWLSP
jgi:hypothetical protein